MIYVGNIEEDSDLIVDLPNFKGRLYVFADRLHPEGPVMILRKNLDHITFISFTDAGKARLYLRTLIDLNTLGLTIYKDTWGWFMPAPPPRPARSDNDLQ